MNCTKVLSVSEVEQCKVYWHVSKLKMIWCILFRIPIHPLYVYLGSIQVENEFIVEKDMLSVNENLLLIDRIENCNLHFVSIPTIKPFNIKIGDYVCHYNNIDLIK